MQSFSSCTRNIAVASSLHVLGVLHVPGPAEALDIVTLITDFGYNGRRARTFSSHSTRATTRTPNSR